VVLSSMQMKWVAGGTIGALALIGGYLLGHRSTSEHGALPLSPREHEHSKRTQAHGHEEHVRGEYGHRRRKGYNHG
jgi:hypothetical protein